MGMGIGVEVLTSSVTTVMASSCKWSGELAFGLVRQGNHVCLRERQPAEDTAD